MFTIDRPHGRSAHSGRVALLRILEDAEILTFHRAELIDGRRHYLVTQADQELLLRDTDIEPYVIGINATIRTVTGKDLPGLLIPATKTKP